MKKDSFNVCMGCGYEWEDSNADWCPMCGCLDFAVEDEDEGEE